MGMVETRAPAKVNLYLGVSHECDEQGYHLVETVLCPLDLADAVRVEELASVADAESTENFAGNAGEPRIELTCEPDPVGDARANLAYRAAKALAERLGRTPHLRIAIEKHIPSQAGLGGGSSDAAATLRCLAELWGLAPTDAHVVEVARGLGADVPFFLYGGACLMTGRGDVFVERLGLPRVSVVLVKPPVGVSTPAAYRAFDRLGTPALSPDELLAALRGVATPSYESLRPESASAGVSAAEPDAAAAPADSAAARRVAQACANNLQPAACAVEPQVGEVLAWLAEQGEGLAMPLLCGSGACCVLFVVDDEAARAVAGRACARGLWAQVTHTVAS